MDASKTTVHENPREKANVTAVLFWTWTLRFFKIGYSRVLEPADLYDPLSSDKSGLLGDKLEREWNREVYRCKNHKKSPSLLRALFRCFWLEVLLHGLLHFFFEFGLRLGTPLLIGGLLHYIRDDSPGSWDCALLYALGITLASCLSAIVMGHLLYCGYHTGGKFRIAVCSLVYRKSLRLSTTALGDTPPGKVINLIANDVNRFDMVFTLIHFMWSAPLSALIVGYFLYTEAGYPGVLGIVVVFIVAPVQSYTGKLSSIFRLQIALKTDERVRLMDEIISGVRVIKMYVWEKPFCAMVELARKLELKVVRKTSWIRGLYMTFNVFTTRMAVYCTLVGMLFMGQPLSAEKVFVFSSYFSVLAHTMSAMFVRGVAEIAESIVAVHRLKHFLMYEELQIATNHSVVTDSNCTKSTLILDFPYIDNENSAAVIASNEIESRETSAANHSPTPQICPNAAVSLQHLTAKWEQYAQENILENVNVNLERGQLYIVIGAVGAGKSSLISAILGEMWITSGRVDIKGGISYASQEAWVFGSTVRQNILFGQPYDRQRYQRVIKACALLSDFKQLPHGDHTVVGERGSSLSGGQRARINLARSVYRQADVYILDDPLSAVDAHVGKHLFEECIQRYLAAKTRILVTHQLQHIEGADAILLLEHGKVTKFANHVELLAARAEYASLLESHLASEATEEMGSDKVNVKRQLSSSSNGSNTSNLGIGDELSAEKVNNTNSANLEDTSKGVMKSSIYRKYFRAGGNSCSIIIVTSFFLVTQLLVTLNDLYFPTMVDAEEKRYGQYLRDIGNSTVNSTGWYEYSIEPAYMYIYIYTAIVLLIFFIAITRSLLFFALTLSSSQRLHDRAFAALIRTSVRFFDTNPSGRILNRFSKDTGAIDELLPRAMLDAAQTILLQCGVIVIVCTVNPVFIAPLAVIVFVFYWLRKVYLRTSKNVKRLEGMLRSPVFTHLNATLNGLSTIRAYGTQEILKSEFDQFQDAHSSAWYMFIVTSMTFSFSLDMCSFFFTAIAILTLLFGSGYSRSEIGLTITTLISMTGMLQWGMRQSAEVENQMMAVERVLEYTLLPAEDNLRDRGLVKGRKKPGESVENNQLTTLPTCPPKYWPSEGFIRFKDVYLRYADDPPPVLRGLNFIITPREKIGIVGRTGAGKSSLISALFRLVKIEGVIEIDGVDTGSIFLEDLRRHISIIPQDPVLFSGTLRKNLDPFGEFSDEELWAALGEVELKDAIVNDVGGLESRVFDRGANYSVGQRQLICLARAILRNNKILMLDEATANVDPHTDGLIQRAIRSKFANCTVLTIAHRLNTIVDSDRVLVMDKGRLVELDHSHILLQNEHGHFTSLVRETGPAMHEQLSKIAKEAYVKKSSERLQRCP